LIDLSLDGDMRPKSANTDVGNGPHHHPGCTLRALASPVRSELRKHTAGRGSIQDLLRDHHFATPSGLGRSTIVSSRMLSMIDRRPRVPVLRSGAACYWSRWRAALNIKAIFAEIDRPGRQPLPARWPGPRSCRCRLPATRRSTDDLP
jgi:hypothetical protein